MSSKNYHIKLVRERERERERELIESQGNLFIYIYITRNLDLISELEIHQKELE